MCVEVPLYFQWAHRHVRGAWAFRLRHPKSVMMLKQPKENEHPPSNARRA